MKKIKVENFISYLVDKERCFWGFIDLDGITLNVYDSKINTDILSVLFYFNEDTSEWINDNKVKIEEIKDVLKDFELIEEVYEEQINQERSWQINTRMTINTLLFIILMYLIKKDNAELSINFFYSPEEGEDMSFNVSKDDTSVVNYCLDEHIVDFPGAERPDQELRSFIDEIYKIQFAKALNCYDI